jgi:hypothetical protein
MISKIGIYEYVCIYAYICGHVHTYTHTHIPSSAYCEVQAGEKHF